MDNEQQLMCLEAQDTGREEFGDVVTEFNFEEHQYIFRVFGCYRRIHTNVLLGKDSLKLKNQQTEFFGNTFKDTAAVECALKDVKRILVKTTYAWEWLASGIVILCLRMGWISIIGFIVGVCVFKKKEVSLMINQNKVVLAYEGKKGLEKLLGFINCLKRNNPDIESNMGMILKQNGEEQQEWCLACEGTGVKRNIIERLPEYGAGCGILAGVVNRDINALVEAYPIIKILIAAYLLYDFIGFCRGKCAVCKGTGKIKKTGDIEAKE